MQFVSLPDEVILHVFSFLKIMEILKCGQTSKRFRAISNDKYLWPKKFNLCFRKVPVGFVQKLLESGCKYLSLSEATLEGTLNLPKFSRLKYLSLSGFKLEDNRENLEKLLGSTYCLEKLSLSRFHLSSNLIVRTTLQNRETLKVLDLSNCTFGANKTNCLFQYPCLDYSTCAYTVPIKLVMENLTELEELNLNMTLLCETSVDILVSSITSKIKKLDLLNMNTLQDKHIQTLLTRCNKISDLQLGGWTSLTKQSLNLIIEHLQSTLVALHFDYSNVEFDARRDLIKLKSMEKLRAFCYHFKDWKHPDTIWLKKQLPNVIISLTIKDPFIARPCYPEFDHYKTLWDIKVEQEELFERAPPSKIEEYFDLDKNVQYQYPWI